MIASNIDILELRDSPDINHLVLSAGTAKRISITGKRGCIFGCDADFYTKPGNSSVNAAVPSSDVTDGTGSIFNPQARIFNGTDTHLSVISDYDCVVTLEFF